MADNIDIEIECPACGKKMTKLYFGKQNTHLDVCLDGCGGICFDNREYNKFDEEHEDISPLVEAYKDKDFKKIDTSTDRICPVCEKKMIKHFSSSKHQIQMDECYHCGSIFLDYEELERIRAEFPTEAERNEAAVNELYGKARKELKEHQLKYEESQDLSISIIFPFFRYRVHQRYFSRLISNYIKYGKIN